MSNWEKVGKTKAGSTKTQRRQVAEKMPKQNIEVAPLKVSKSVFGAFEEKSEMTKAKQPLQDRSNVQASPKGNKKPKKPKKPSSAQFRHDTFIDAIRDVSAVTVYKRATEQRKSVQIWQKDIAHFINETISCPEESPAFLERDFSYPISKVPKSTHLMLKKLFVEETSSVIRQLLFDHCMLTLMDSMAKDYPTWGYRLCAQVLAHNDPEACISDLDRELEKISNMKNSPKRCLAYMWALGQVGVGDARTGMRVWLDVMMPLISMKNLAGYVVHYLETLIASVDNPQKRLSGTINADHYFQIMKWTFDPTTGLASNLRERLQAVYKNVHVIATDSAPSKLAIFGRFLRTPVSEMMRIKPELMDVTFQCLQENPICFGKWRESYLSSLPQTRLLLEYLKEGWDESVRGLSRKEFANTVRAFHNCNVDAAAQSSAMTSTADFKILSALCKHFTTKIQEKSSGRFASRCNTHFISVTVALLGIGIGLLLYDVKLHGGVKQSASYQKLESSGTLAILNQAWGTISTILQHANKWLQSNVPHFWSRLNDILGPYLAYIGTRLLDFFHLVAEATAPLRAEISVYARYGLLWVDEVFQKAVVVAQDAYMALRPTLLAVSDWIWEKGSVMYSFLSGQIGWCCVKDAVVKYSLLVYNNAVDVCVFIWSYVLYVFKIASDYVAGENM